MWQYRPARATTNLRCRPALAVSIAALAAVFAVAVGAADPSGASTSVRRSHPGALDATFGVDGIVRTDIGSHADMARAVAIQADGKAVVSGVSFEDGDTSAFAVARYTTTGVLDRTFGSGGQVITEFAGGADADAVAVQHDGKIVVAGTAGVNGDKPATFALARYNRDGSLDRSFGTGGRVTTSLDGYAAAAAVVIQADGKLVVVGTAGLDHAHDSSFALVRYGTDGSLDPSFGRGGIVMTNLAVDGDDEAYTAAIQADQRVVVAGVSDSSPGFVLTRYNRDGKLDGSFGSHGTVSTPFSGGARPNALAVQPDGGLVAAGVARWSSSNSTFALARYHPNGSLDATFGSHGRVTTNVTAGADWANSVALERNGRIVVAGSAGSANSRFALARYNRDGSPDATFGHGGRVTTDFTSYSDGAYGVAVAPDGKVVAAGEAGAFGGSKSQFALARYDGV